jgi:hypothetical protein
LFHQYFEKPRVLRGIESANFESHLNSFARELDAVGFARVHVRNQLRAAAHLCVWAGRQRVNVEGFNEDLISRFRLHLAQCQCPGPKRGRSSLVVGWAQRFVEHLRRVGVLPAVIVDPKETRPVLLQEFLTWMRQHRGVGEASLQRYEYHLVDLLDCLGMIRAALRLTSFEASFNNRAGITPALEEPRSFSRRCGCSCGTS